MVEGGGKAGFTLDKDGKVEGCNAKAVEMLGMEKAADVIGKEFVGELVGDEVKEETAGAIEKALGASRSQLHSPLTACLGGMPVIYSILTQNVVSTLKGRKS